MKIQAVDIGRTASAASIIFDALRKAIIMGELKDGDPLRQDELARMFNTSRIPVREALTRLEQHGLVRTVRYKGAVVAGLTPEQVTEIFDFRILVEGEIILRAVPNMTPAIIAEARRHCDAEGGGDRDGDNAEAADWGERNRRFHATLHSAAALPYHLNAAAAALDQIDRYLRARLLLNETRQRSSDQHQAILAACERGDAREARRLMQAHIRTARDSLVEHLK